MRLSRRHEPEVVIEFDAPVNVVALPGGAHSVWTHWRDGKVVGFAAPGDLEHVKRSFWDSVLMQYVTELRAFAQTVRN